MADRDELPATLSPRILRDLLRRKMRFNGVVVSDALDMHAMEQGSGYVAEAMAAVAAGIDLLLFNHDLSRVEPACSNLVQAARRGLLSDDEIHASARRIMALKSWIKRQQQESLAVIGCKEHLQLAQEVARKSVTLVRDTARHLPLRVGRGREDCGCNSASGRSDSSRYLVVREAGARGCASAISSASG